MVRVRGHLVKAHYKKVKGLKTKVRVKAHRVKSYNRKRARR